MVVRGLPPSYPPKGFELPQKPASEGNPWQGYCHPAWGGCSHLHGRYNSGPRGC